MERDHILEMMGELKLAGMRHAYDDVIADAVKRQHSAPRVVGDLLTAEIAEKQARSIKYQMTMATGITSHIAPPLRLDENSFNPAAPRGRSDLRQKGV